MLEIEPASFGRKVNVLNYRARSPASNLNLLRSYIHIEDRKIHTMWWKIAQCLLRDKLIQYLNEKKDYEELRWETLRLILLPVLGHIWHIPCKYLLGK